MPIQVALLLNGHNAKTAQLLDTLLSARRELLAQIPAEPALLMAFSPTACGHALLARPPIGEIKNINWTAIRVLGILGMQAVSVAPLPTQPVGVSRP